MNGVVSKAAKHYWTEVLALMHLYLQLFIKWRAKLRKVFELWIVTQTAVKLASSFNICSRLSCLYVSASSSNRSAHLYRYSILVVSLLHDFACVSAIKWLLLDRLCAWDHCGSCGLTMLLNHHWRCNSLSRCIRKHIASLIVLIATTWLAQLRRYRCFSLIALSHCWTECWSTISSAVASTLSGLVLVHYRMM